MPSFPHNFSSYVFFKNNNLPVYYDSTKNVIILKKDENNIFEFKEFVKLPEKIQTFETLSMAIKYSDDFNFTYEEIINSIDSKYFIKNEVYDVYFLFNKENELNEKDWKEYKSKLKKIIQKPITEKFKNILAKKNFVIKNLDVLNTYRKIIEIENNEEKEVLKSFLFATILKSKKGSL